MNEVPRLKANDFHPLVLKLFDQYVHGSLNRDAFLTEVGPFTLPGFNALDLLAALNPKFAENVQVPDDDPRIKTEVVEFASPSGNGNAQGYLAVPANPNGKRGLVLVVHENRGLNPHIKDVARRFALEGFIVLAPDALFPVGGYPGDEDRARELFTQLDRGRSLEDFAAGVEFLAQQPAGNGNVGVVGFCYGGGVAHQLATRLPDLGAAVSFYGGSPAPEQAHKVRTTLQVHLASVDERINAAWPAYEEALVAAHVNYQVYTYADTQHGFHNDTTPRYDQAAAELAWQRTVELLRSRLMPGKNGNLSVGV